MPVKLNHRFTVALLIIILCTKIKGPNLLICHLSSLSSFPLPPVPICGRDATVKRRAISGIVVKAELTWGASESAIYLMFSSLLLHPLKTGRTRSKESAAPGWVSEEERALSERKGWERCPYLMTFTYGVHFKDLVK